MASRVSQHDPAPLSLSERLSVAISTTYFPFIIAIKIFSKANKKRTWARAASDSTMRVLLGSGWNIRQIVHAMGSTTQLYAKWARQMKLEVLTDEVGEGAKLHWIGPRHFDRVFLYAHGGGFSLPVKPHEHLNFLLQVQKDLEANAGGVGVIALEYSLTPDSPFPTQLRQANAAISHLISKGVDTKNIVLGGDSAGGNLVLQIAAHILHPLPDIPAPPTSGPFGGAFLMSPWVTFDDSSPSFAENDKLDTTSAQALNFLAMHAQTGITPETRNYVEAITADESWWTGLDKVFLRILNTAGQVECLRDAIVTFGETLKKHVKDTTNVVEKNAVHEDVLRDFSAGQGVTSENYKLDIEWLSDTFKGQR